MGSVGWVVVGRSRLVGRSVGARRMGRLGGLEQAVWVEELVAVAVGDEEDGIVAGDLAVAAGRAG